MSCASTTASIGPFTPGPKPSDSRSAALRWVVSGLEVVSAGSASSILSTGAVSATSESTTTAMVSPGTRWTNCTQRLPIVGLCRGRRCFLREVFPATPGILPLKALSPNAPSSAGMKVSATSTDTNTVPAAASPIAERNSILAMTRATSATNTVVPAKTTEEPAVPTAIPAASSPDMRCRSARYRERMNSE